MEQSEIKQRESLIQDILEHMQGWDGTAFHATDILEANQSLFDQVKEIQAFDVEEEKQQWMSLLPIHRKMQQAIEEEREKLMSQLAQLSKSEKVMNHYVQDKRPSIFVDKDF